MPQVVEFDETGGPEVLHAVERTVADPGPGEVRLALELIGVNRLDAMSRAGQSPRPVPLPRARLGLEASGRIESVGPEVAGLAVGDPVLITAVPDAEVNGSYAEALTLPAARVIRRPDGLDAAAAAALWVSYSTAYGALVEKSGLRPGDRILITAASSGIGLAAIQIANQLGAVPLAVTRSAAKRARLLEAGAAAVIVSDEEDVPARTRELTDGIGADIIIDAVMGPGLAPLATAARFAGTLVSVGWLDPRPPVLPAVPLTLHRYMSFEHTLDPVVVARMAAFLGAGVRLGAIAPAIDRILPLAEAAQAHRRLESGQGFGKVLLSV
jgi:NADPH:quinone reductase